MSNRKPKTNSEGKAERIAFVISPIGDPDSPQRKRADQILNHIIKPIVSELGYKAIRSDKISKPGIITSQIVNHIVNDPLVIADLTGQNPNVFYELAIRHAIKKPVIQIIKKGERIPFDVSITRTIHINHQDLDSVDYAKKELRKQVKAVEKDPTLVDSPISVAIDLQFLKRSSDPDRKALAQLRTTLHDVKFIVADIQSKLTTREHSRMHCPDCGSDRIMINLNTGESMCSSCGFVFSTKPRIKEEIDWDKLLSNIDLDEVLKRLGKTTKQAKSKKSNKEKD